MRPRALIRVLLVVGALGAAPLARAGEIDIGPLRAWELPGYTLIAADDYNPRFVVQRLVNTQNVLSKLLATPVRANGVPTTVWLAPRRIWDRHLAPSGDIVGEFVPRRFANYLIVDAGIERELLRVGVQHEYTHYFLRTQFGGLYPLWFDEGLAEIVGNAQLRHDSATFPPPFVMTYANWIRMSRLFELDKTSREYLEEPWTTTVHLESWALVHRGLLAEKSFGGKLFDYLSAVNRLVPVEDAAVEAFGMNFEQLDESMQKYLRRSKYAVGKLSIAGAPLPKLPGGRVLGAAEASIALARVALDTGFMPQHTREVVDAARTLDPGAPAVAVLELRLAVRDRNDTEAIRLARTLDANDDPATQRGVGLALFERVREPKDDAALPAATRADFEQRAFALLDRALQLDPGEPAAAWGFALLAVRMQTGVDRALARLAIARTRMADHPDLAEATARALEAQGANEAAILPHLAVAFRYTSSAEQRAWAAQRIRELHSTQKEKAPL